MSTKLPQKKGTVPHPIFGPCLLYPNSWMDQYATWYGGKLRPRRRCVRWGPSSPLKGAQLPVFGPCLLWPNGWMDEDATWYISRPQPRPHCVRLGSSSPRERGTAAPVFSAHVYCGHSRPSELLLSSCQLAKLGVWGMEVPTGSWGKARQGPGGRTPRSYSIL